MGEVPGHGHVLCEGKLQYEDALLLLQGYTY